MRPLDKGACPKDTNGKDKTVTHYSQWRYDLIKRIGAYCSYCNMPLSHNLQVEHVIAKTPKSGNPAGDLLSWENVLLACGPCNRAKSNNKCDSTMHYLPEEHNTLLPFISVAKKTRKGDDAMIINKSGNLVPAQQLKAEATIKLMKLDNLDDRDAIVDLRWLHRWNESIKVQVARKLLEENKLSPSYNPDCTGKCIATMANGFFMLWFNEFENEPAVIKWLIDPTLHPGVATSCFDGTYKPIHRNPGQPDPI